MKQKPEATQFPTPNNQLLRLSLWVFMGLLAYMPLHILISTWVGTSFGILEFMRVAKEGFLAVGAGIALVLGIRIGVVGQLVRDKLMWLIAAFAALNVLLALWRPTDRDAELLGLVYNIRFLVFFVWAVILAKLYAGKELSGQAVKIVLAVGAAVVAFGLFQYFLLPDDALKHLGYERANGVLPAFFIDDKPDLERIMSTVRDPNSFGSYLLILLGFEAVRAKTALSQKKKMYHVCFALLILLAVLLTFSRAAWIGAAATLGTAAVILFSFGGQATKLSRKSGVTRLDARRTGLTRNFWKYSLLIALFCSLLITGAVYSLRNTYLVQNVIFHADESTVLEDPNELRVRFWSESIDDITSEPLGSGPGTAGLASIRNDERTVLNENYYLQTAQEVGVLGLILFLAIIGIVAARLLARAKTGNPLAIALLAGLAGLMITNFLAHIWANEAVAYTWWGLAGLALAAEYRSKST